LTEGLRGLGGGVALGCVGVAYITQDALQSVRCVYVIASLFPLMLTAPSAGGRGGGGRWRGGRYEHVKPPDLVLGTLQP
jgi:hypothetical protein